MHDHDHDHGPNGHHDHDHGHGHGPNGHHHHHEPQSYDALRTKAVESLLIEKGLLTSELVDGVIRRYEQDLGPMNGAKLVARAWVDPEFKRQLLTDARAAANEFGFADYQGLLVVTENTPSVHNVIVCTLCSCYPMGLLGLPPAWYKSFAYRSRVVIEPRAVLREFGLDVPESVEVRVWDSSAEQRYMVLPERPVGTEGLSEAELAALVSRDALIGVARAKDPALAVGRA